MKKTQNSRKKRNSLLTAPEVAKLLQVDLKTIHNWVGKSELKSFRTPGRHLRFTREQVIDFMNETGFPIPDYFREAEMEEICEHITKDEWELKYEALLEVAAQRINSMIPGTIAREKELLEKKVGIYLSRYRGKNGS